MKYSPSRVFILTLSVIKVQGHSRSSIISPLSAQYINATSESTTVQEVMLFLSDRLQKGSPILSVRCLSCCLSCPVCNVGVLWPNGWTDQDETWHAGRLGPVHIVLDGDAGPLPQRGNPPIFSPYLFWLNGSMDQDATWC